MGSFTLLVKQTWFRLIPFVASVAVYSTIMRFTYKAQWWTALVKCAPIISLMLFVLFFGFQNLKSNTYPRKILLGLFFSAIGDILLDFSILEGGVAAFLVAQIFYIWAFGWNPFMWWIGVILYVVASTLTGILIKHMDTISLYVLPIYALFLTTMSWRALARIALYEDNSLLLTRIICGIGSILFFISDSVVAFDRFYVDIPNSIYYIMITYYVAQLGIALSVVPVDSSYTKHLTADEPSGDSVEPKSRQVAKGSRLTD